MCFYFYWNAFSSVPYCGQQVCTNDAYVIIMVEKIACLLYIYATIWKKREKESWERVHFCERKEEEKIYGDISISGSISKREKIVHTLVRLLYNIHIIKVKISCWQAAASKFVLIRRLYSQCVVVRFYFIYILNL